MREKYLGWLGNLEGKLILDCCCGNGYVSRKLESAGAKVMAFDRDTSMINNAMQIHSTIDYRVLDLKDVGRDYKGNLFDVILLAGMPCFLDENQLYKAFNDLSLLLKEGGILLASTFNAEAYFKNAKSNWLIFTSKPDTALLTQETSIDFYNSDGEIAFTGKCYAHTNERLKDAFHRSGLEVYGEHAPIASQEDIKNYLHMWIDEVRVPFHVALLGRKNKEIN